MILTGVLYKSLTECPRCIKSWIKKKRVFYSIILTAWRPQTNQPMAPLATSLTKTRKALAPNSRLSVFTRKKNPKKNNTVRKATNRRKARNLSQLPDKSRSIVRKKLLMRKPKTPSKKEQTIREERSRTKKNPKKLRHLMTLPWHLRSAKKPRRSVKRKRRRNKKSTSNLCQSNTNHLLPPRLSLIANTASSCLANGADARASPRFT